MGGSGSKQRRSSKSSVASASSAASNADVPRYGVSAAWLRQFVEENVDLENDTTGDVCVRIVEPRTEGKLVKKKLRRRTCAYYELLANVKGPDGRPATAPATTFVSHAWKYKFNTVVSTILADDESNEGEKHYYWIDMLSTDQHPNAERQIDWYRVFETAIPAVGRVLLVMSPWNAPVPLSRCWCLWEVFCAVNSQTRLDVALPPDQKEVFSKEIAQDWQALVKAFGALSARDAEASRPEDREKIHEAIEGLDGGFDHVDATVKDQIRQWSITVGLAAGVAADETKAGARLCNGLGLMMRQIGETERALEMYNRALQIYQKVCGPEHRNTAATYNNIGAVYAREDDLEKALEMYKKALDIYLMSLGSDHSDTASTYNNIGLVYCKQEKYDLALKMYDRALDIRRKTAGEDHVSMATCYNNIGLVYREQRNYEKALEMFEKALEIERKHLGEDHPETAASHFNIGVACHHIGASDKKMTSLKRALTVYNRTLGPDHANTKAAQEWLM